MTWGPSPFPLLVACALGCNAGDDIPPPTISMMSPTHAPPGVTVMVLGGHFCQQLDTSGDPDPLRCDHTGSVAFGTAPGTIGTYSDTSISVEVPTLSPGRVAVSVTVSGRVSNSVDFQVDAP